MGTKIRSARMTNIRRHLPETYLFTTDLPVRVTDLSYGNHLGNDAFVACRHEARARWLHQYTWTELDMNGSGLIMVELAVRCSKAAAVLGNTLRIKLAVQEWAPCGFALVYNRRTHFDGGLILAEQRLVDHGGKIFPSTSFSV